MSVWSVARIDSVKYHLAEPGAGFGDRIWTLCGVQVGERAYVITSCAQVPDYGRACAECVEKAEDERAAVSVAGAPRMDVLAVGRDDRPVSALSADTAEEDGEMTGTEGAAVWDGCAVHAHNPITGRLAACVQDAEVEVIAASVKPNGEFDGLGVLTRVCRRHGEQLVTHYKAVPVPTGDVDQEES